LKLPKEVKSNPKQKSVWFSRNHSGKGVKLEMAVKKRLWQWVYGKYFNSDNSDKFGTESSEGNTNSPGLLLLNFLSLT